MLIASKDTMGVREGSSQAGPRDPTQAIQLGGWHFYQVNRPAWPLIFLLFILVLIWFFNY